MTADPDVVVIGAGPNGLTSAVLLARAGLRVLVLEAGDAIGGAARTAEVTLPGFRHDPFSAFFPLARAGPLRDLPLEDHGLQWCTWSRPYGGASLGGPGVTQHLDLAATIAGFDRAHAGDGAGWRELYGYWRRGGSAFQSLLFNPLGHPAPLLKALPLLASPAELLRFAQLTAGSARALADRFLAGEEARVWLMGSVLHSDLSPDDAGGGGFGLLLCGLSQELGMPIPRGGAQAIPDALARLLAHHGGRVLTGHPATQVVVRNGRAVAVRTPHGEFAARRAVLATVQPQALFMDLVGEGHLPSRFVRLVRGYRWGSGTFQLNVALSALPQFRAEQINTTLVVHLARSVDELTRGAVAPRRGALPAHPLLIAGFHTLADPSRAPAGKHTLWAMTHVPTHIASDDAHTISGRRWSEAKQAFTDRLLDELDAFAPGFRASILAVHAQSPEDLAIANPNLVGGDIGTGTYTLDQQLVFRPFPGVFRYKTPISGLYVSGAATHPGGGVHGAPGANAARVLLADLRLRPLARATASLTRVLAPPETRDCTDSLQKHPARLLRSSDGVGPLVERQYANRISRHTSPQDVMQLIGSAFPELVSQPYARFARVENGRDGNGTGGHGGPLQIGDRVSTSMPGAGTYYVQVVEQDERRLLLQTLEGHPEAGHVTISAEHAPDGGVLVRVVTRTRSNGLLNRVGYALLGAALQRRLWRTFLRRVARSVAAVA